MTAANHVYIEQGARRCFACSLEWPGLCRSAKDEAQALAVLSSYVGRYAAVVRRAGLPFDLEGGAGWVVLARVPTRSGGADFGVPTSLVPQDLEPWGHPERDRATAVLAAAWGYLDDVVASAPAELRKGPRGGGRDRDAIAAHVAGGEQLYARKVGLKLPSPDGGRETVLANRSAILGWLRGHGATAEAAPQRPSGPKGWPARYAARRLSWHVLDHAWEIEDRGR